MPIFEYTCRNCKHSFEAIVLNGRAPQCPRCESARLEQRLSRFAVNRGSESASSEPAGACGSCGDPRGPGSCALD